MRRRLVRLHVRAGFKSMNNLTGCGPPSWIWIKALVQQQLDLLHVGQKPQQCRSEASMASLRMALHRTSGKLSRYAVDKVHTYNMFVLDWHG